MSKLSPLVLTSDQVNILEKLMISSARKGNLPNASLVLQNGRLIASSESLVATNHDATAHSERILVETVCRQKKSHYTPGLVMVSVVEPCLMCLSACSQAGYSALAYIIPAHRYIKKILYVTDTTIDKLDITKSMINKIELIRLSEYTNVFCKVFEKEVPAWLKKSL